MSLNCPKCGAKVIKYPVKDENGRWIVKNLFKMDFLSFIFLVVILFSAWAYKHDMASCFELREEPCAYCGPYQDMKADRFRQEPTIPSSLIINNSILLPER